MKRQISVFVLIVTFVFACAGMALATDEQPLVNIFLFETGIRDALSEITIQTGVNIIPDSTVSGVITADLQDVPLEKALRLVLVGGGFTFKKIDDFYLVGLPDPRSSTFGELVETRIVRLTHVTAEEVLTVLPNFLASYVKGERDGKVLTVTAPSTELARIAKLVEAVDQPLKQVEVQVIVTEVSSSVLKDIGIDLFSYATQAGQTVNKDWQGSLGFDGKALALNLDIYGQLLSRLKLAQQNQEAKIHANPKVLVAAGKTAELFIGDRQIILLSGNNDTTSRVERVEVGVSLKVTPQIVGDEIILNIAPELSHFLNNGRPDLVVKQSSVATTVKLANGQTAMLAGMTVQEQTDYSRKVPILGDIPLIRWFFRNDVVQEVDKELLIFVTPVILQ